MTSSSTGSSSGWIFIAAQKAPIKNIPWNDMRIVVKRFPNVNTTAWTELRYKANDPRDAEDD
jgi:hypothetical protein